MRTPTELRDSTSPHVEGLIEAVARHLWGEPNEQLSKPGELRFGTNGSKSVDLDKLQFYDHEQQVGGSTLQLIKLEIGCADRKAQCAWLLQNGFISGAEGKRTSGGEVMQAMKSCTAAAPPQRKAPSKIAATYDYRDEAGELLMQVVRMEPKTFRQRRPDGDGWSWSVKGVRPVPYRLPELLAAPDAVVFVVEGEKDADRLASLGLVGTCNAGGAGKWTDAHATHLSGRRVVILPDNDTAGQAHAQKVLKSLRGIASDVRIVNLPGLPDKGDVSDWLDAGHDADELLCMVEAAAPAPEPEKEEKEERESQADLIVKFALGRHELLHDDQKAVYARSHDSGMPSRRWPTMWRNTVSNRCSTRSRRWVLAT